jgi:membrane-associated protease RseP (regulator of RpoE activity)
MTLPTTEIHPQVFSSDPYYTYVSKIMRIEEKDWGAENQNYIIRYRGKLYSESSKSYDQLSESLRDLDITPLFRLEEDRHTIVLIKGVVKPSPSNKWVNLILFILTVFSVLFAGIFSNYLGPFVLDFDLIWPHLVEAFKLGLAFTVSLLAILLAHEFGHYLAARYHKTTVTLPYFIPLPISPFGTMGAFILQKEPPKNKRILLDIGIAGPLAGLVIAIPLLFLGLLLSEVDRLPLVMNQVVSLEGNSILYLLAKFIVFGQWLPDPGSYAGLNPIIYWVRYLFTGDPFPLGGVDVLLHPVAWAGWAGLLVTALNLIPAGQLDGGHILYSLLGKKSRMVIPFVLVALLALGTVWSGWWLWALLIFLLGRRHAEPLDQITPLDPNRKVLAVFGLLVFILVFTPVPLSIFEL